DLITIPGLINLDFADVRAIMADAGSALMGIGSSAGESRASEAAKAAISSPLLEESVEGATGILLNITGGKDLGLFEVNEAAELQVLVVPGLSLGPVTSDYAHNAIEVLAGLLCLGGAWQARREQNAWLLIGIGVLAWALGNLYYTVVLYDMESPPIPSPADAG